MPNTGHVVHLGSRAVGGAGLVMVEAASVAPDARISDKDIGIWNSAQVDQFRQITEFVKSQGAAPAIQLAHAGRKGSTHVPWLGRNAVPVHEGGWSTMGPSRSEEHTSELQSLMRTSYAVFCLKKKNKHHSNYN